jgi:large subunit ribosomal protein L6e
MAPTPRKSTRNPELISGLRRFGHTAANKKAAAWKFSKKPATKPAPKTPAMDITKPRFYSPVDVKRPVKSLHLGRKSSTKLRSNITPGTVLILLAGRFRGKRVVFLKQLASGLLLVTGPYKINGVPLRRVNQAYVISTSTKVDVSKVDTTKVTDALFTKPAEKSKKGEFLEDKKEKSSLPAEFKTTQKNVDSAILSTIKSTPQLHEYLNAKFSLTKGQKPHAMKF